MTDHRMPHVAGEAATTFLTRRNQALVDDILGELVAHLPVYARLPRELLQGDVRSVVEDALRLFVRSLSDDLAEADLERLGSSAVRRAEEGVPMEVVLAAYHRGARVATDAAIGVARADELDDVRRLVGLVLDYLERLTAAVAAGYARHGRSVQAERSTARQVLVHALLAGDDPRTAAGQADVALAEHYLVAAVAVGPHPDELDPGVDRGVAGRRKLRRLREELQRHYATEVLWAPAHDGGLALVPGDDVRRLREVRAEVQRIAGAAVHVGVVAATVDAVPAAAPLAREIAEVARHLDRPAGVYELGDVALEYQLSRPTPARPLLAALLDPLAVEPELRVSLEVFLECGLNRRKAAARLHVHPNTVDNRLRKVAALTGLDATRADHLPTLTAALAARA